VDRGAGAPAGAVSSLAVRAENGRRTGGCGGPAPRWLTEHCHRDPPLRLEGSDLLGRLAISSPFASSRGLGGRRRERQEDMPWTAREMLLTKRAAGRSTASPPVWNGGRVRANAPVGVERGDVDGVGGNPGSVLREGAPRLAPGARPRSEPWRWIFFGGTRRRWRIGRRGGIGAGRAAIPGLGSRVTPDRAAFLRGTRPPRGTRPQTGPPRGRTSVEERQQRRLPPASAARIPPRRRLLRPTGCLGCLRGGKVQGQDLVHPLSPPIRRAADLRRNDERGRGRLGESRIRHTVGLRSCIFGGVDRIHAQPFEPPGPGAHAARPVPLLRGHGRRVYR